MLRQRLLSLRVRKNLKLKTVKLSQKMKMLRLLRVIVLRLPKVKAQRLLVQKNQLNLIQPR